MYIDTETVDGVSSVLEVTVDADRVYSYFIPASVGKMRRYYLRGNPVKGKVFQFKITNSTGVRVFNSSCVHVSRWERGPEDRYDRVNPFGGPTGAQEGAVV